MTLEWQRNHQIISIAMLDYLKELDSEIFNKGILEYPAENGIIPGMKWGCGTAYIIREKAKILELIREAVGYNE